MSIASVNGTQLYYCEIGSGPLCLVLHGGLGLDHTAYRDFDRLAGRRRVVYYDHRGNGRSARPEPATLTMPQLADDAAALIAHLGADRAAVIGHSYGGFVAQELAIRHPERVEALVLVDTAPGRPGRDEPPPDPAPPLPADLAAAMASAPPTDALFAAGFRDLLRHYVHRIDVAELARRFADVRFDAAAMTRSMRLLAEWSAADRLGAVTAPTLVVVGRHDVITPPAQARRIARAVPGAWLVECPDSGHFPWVEEPEEFFATVEAWLDEAGHRPPGDDLPGPIGAVSPGSRGVRFDTFDR